MSAERDVNRIVRSWIRTEEHESADRVLQAVLSRLDTTPQRRPTWLPRRSSSMSNLIRVALATAAVLVVAFIGLRMLPATPGPGSPSAGPTGSPTPAITPTPSVPPSSPPTLPAGAIAPGTYLVKSYTQTPFLVTVPDGWNVTLGMLATGDFYNEATAVLLRPWIVTHVYADACQWRGSMRPVGSTKAELVAALSAQTGRDADGPTEVTLGGLQATRFILSVPAAFDTSGCDDGYLRPWPDTDGNEDIGPPMFKGSITEVYVVESGGKATAIQAARYEGSPAADVAELRAVLDSIVFVP